MQKVKNVILLLWQHPQYTMPLIILIWGVYYFIYGAVINVNNGLGYDGVFYGNLVKYFYEFVFNQQLSFYFIQRIFPSFLIHIFLAIFEIPKENFFIVKTFQLYNLILLMLCTFLWYRISKTYKLNLRLIWLGFILGFVNFGIAEMPFYYPVLTDITAFFFGFCLLYFHIKNNVIGKIIITILGAFTWPSFIYFAILLIIFPVNFKIDFDDFSSQNLKSRNKVLAFLIPLPFFVIAIYFITNYLFTGTLKLIHADELIPSFLYISAVLNFLLLSYFFIIFLPNNVTVAKYLRLLKKVLTNIKIEYFLISIFLFVIIYSIQKYLSNDLESKAFITLIYDMSLYSCIKPFIYIVVTITYFGSCFVILFFYLKNFKSHLKNLGIGVYLSFIIFFTMILGTETRRIINFLPFIILLSVLVLKDLNIQKNLFILITIFSFILSKVYIPMFNVPSSNENMFQFPDQLFFMNSYMISNNSYYIQLPIIILMIVCVLFIIKKNKQNQVQAANIRI